MSIPKSLSSVPKHTKLVLVVEPPQGFTATRLLRYTEPRALVDAYVRHAHAGRIPGCFHIPSWMTRHEIHIDVAHPATLEVKQAFLQRLKQREDNRAAEIADAVNAVKIEHQEQITAILAEFNAMRDTASEIATNYRALIIKHRETVESSANQMEMTASIIKDLNAKIAQVSSAYNILAARQSAMNNRISRSANNRRVGNHDSHTSASTKRHR